MNNFEKEGESRVSKLEKEIERDQEVERMREGEIKR